MIYEYEFTRCHKEERDEVIGRWAGKGWRLVQVVEYGPTVLFLFEREKG